MNLKELIQNSLNRESVACCVPLGVQHATNRLNDATADATTAQQTRCNPSKTGLSYATAHATTAQQSCCTPQIKEPLFVALKKRVARDVAGMLRDDELNESAIAWRLSFADPLHALTHMVAMPPMTRAQVFERFKNEGLTACEVDQSCKSCGWRVGHAVHGSPVWCANPKKQNDLKPVYSPNHPAREPPDDGGATCEQFTSKT